MSPAGPILVQGMGFALAGFAGIIVGVGLDIYRAVRRVLRPPRPVGHALDVLFVAAVVPVVAGGLVAADWGAMRIYPLLGEALGVTAYLLLASPTMLPAHIRVFSALVALLRAIAHALWAPPLWVGRQAAAAVARLRRPRPPEATGPDTSSPEAEVGRPPGQKKERIQGRGRGARGRRAPALGGRSRPGGRARRR